MNRKPWLRFVLVAATALAVGTAVAADPSLHEVYRAVEAGHLKEAEGMMDKVLRDHPGSAKAHYVEAEVLAREGQLERARSELATAERTSPGLPFAKPEAVDALKAHLAPPTRAARPVTIAEPAVASPVTSRVPWGLVIAVLAVIVAIAFFARSTNRTRALPAAGAGYMPGATSYGPGAYPQPAGAGGIGPVGPGSSGMGAGILGGLATGAAVGAGMVAGEALMHRVFNGGSNSHSTTELPASSPLGDPLSAPDTNFDLGGDDFGISDGGSWDDSPAGGSDDWS
jgi:hypothetical protein